MAEGKGYCSTQLVEGDGTFNVDGIENFVEEVKLAECGNSYAVISIMGPQSSGKSTLLNHLFGTKFKEMDAREGRAQTTKGIWLARCASIEPCTLVMDLEGSDGRERGEDDTAFERQSALFALAVSDIVLINIWNHDIGREHAASKPLLRTVFQVMLRLFSPRKTTLMFVIRDKTDTPLKRLESILMTDVHEIWNSIPKPRNHMGTCFNNFFKMEFVDLPNYYHAKDEFKGQVASLRPRFFHSIAPGGLAGDRQGVVPGSAFSLSTQRIWKSIKENKDLDLQAHKVMVAKLRCKEIAKEKLESFVANEKWCRLKEDVKAHLIRRFGKIFSSIVDTYLLEYDEEAAYFDEGTRSERRNKLEVKLLQIGEPAYQLTLGHIGSITLDKFKESFDKALNEGKEFSVAACDCTQSAMAQFNEGCADATVERANWDSFEARQKLQQNIDAHTMEVRLSKSQLIIAQFQTQLNEALSGRVEKLLIGAQEGTWRAIRQLLSRENESVASRFSAAVSSFNMDVQTKSKLQANLETHARGLVEYTAKRVAENALEHMLNRFEALFCYESKSSTPRVWTKKEEIGVTAEMACSACLKMLSVLAAIRLNDDADNIEETLSIALMAAKSIESVALDVGTWRKVSETNTMITPPECKDLWKKFKDVTEQCATDQVAQKPARKITWGKVARFAFKVGITVLNVGLVATTGTDIALQ